MNATRQEALLALRLTEPATVRLSWSTIYAPKLTRHYRRLHALRIAQQLCGTPLCQFHILST